MLIMSSSPKTNTIETFILPSQFEEYTQKGYIVFLSQESERGTYRAIKIELITQ